MADSPIRGFPLADNSDAANLENSVNPALEDLDDAPRLSRGSLASIPDPGETRTFYEITDSGGGRLVYDNGFVWMDIVRFRSGTIGLRPDADVAGPGTIYADERGTHWRSDGTNWVWAGGA